MRYASLATLAIVASATVRASAAFARLASVLPRLIVSSMICVAVNGSIGPAGLLLFGVVFFWQPPHVWAIALYRKADYEAAGIPMLPSVIGDHPTRWRMLWYTIGLVPVTLAPVALGLLGWVYGTVAVVMNAWFLWAAVEVLREQDDASAQAMFRVSLAYLFALFLAMLADLAWKALA